MSPSKKKSPPDPHIPVGARVVVAHNGKEITTTVLGTRVVIDDNEIGAEEGIGRQYYISDQFDIRHAKWWWHEKYVTPKGE